MAQISPKASPMAGTPAVFSLSGRVALVTGGGGGLGGGMALALAEAGAEIALIDISQSAMESVAGRIASVGRRCKAIVGDLRRIADIGKMVESIVDEFGRLDVAVNGAGINVRKPALEYGVEEWNAIVDVNLKALFFCCQEEARAMLKSGKGKIINITSLTSENGFPNRSIYAASKGGVTSLSRVLAAEWAPRSINVNCIGPGQMLTPLTQELFLATPDGDKILSKIPVGRFGNPKDLEGAIVFLASDASDYVVGQTIYVDGGWLLNTY
jgi:2-deoxy-D-gluconate 3-dehydrogenase